MTECRLITNASHPTDRNLVRETGEKSVKEGMKWWGETYSFQLLTSCSLPCTQTHTRSHQISHRDSSANNAIDRLELLKQCGIIMTGENTYVFSIRVQTFKCGVYSFLCTFSAYVIHLPILTLSEECCFKVQNGFSVPFQCNKLSQPLLNQSGWLFTGAESMSHTHTHTQDQAGLVASGEMYIISILNLFRY